MSANANIIDLVKGNSTLMRPRFSPGLLLRDEDLNEGVTYTRELSRLLFRSLFGCGVVCGLEVSVEVRCGKVRVTVAPGVALNAAGDPIHVPKSTFLDVDPDCGKQLPANLWVILCSKSKCYAPRSTVCGCEEDEAETVCTRERDSFEIRLLASRPDRCACGCPEVLIPAERPTPRKSSDRWCTDPCGCHKEHYAGTCSCDCDCDPDCVVLAVLTDVRRDDRYDGHPQGDDGSTNPWVPNHSVRRFVRPVLMRDPVPYGEQFEGDPCAPQAEPPPEEGEKEQPIILLDRQGGDGASTGDTSSRGAGTGTRRRRAR